MEKAYIVVFTDYDTQETLVLNGGLIFTHIESASIYMKEDFKDDLISYLGKDVDKNILNKLDALEDVEDDDFFINNSYAAIKDFAGDVVYEWKVIQITI